MPDKRRYVNPYTPLEGDKAETTVGVRYHPYERERIGTIGEVRIDGSVTIHFEDDYDLRWVRNRAHYVICQPGDFRVVL